MPDLRIVLAVTVPVVKVRNMRVLVLEGLVVRPKAYPNALHLPDLLTAGFLRVFFSQELHEVLDFLNLLGNHPVEQPFNP